MMCSRGIMRRDPPGQKPAKPKNGTAAAIRHMGRVKELDCVACGAPGPSQAHHCTGGGMRRDDFKTIPLCYACHQGPEGYHARKKPWVAKYGPDHGFLEHVAELLKNNR
jgi:hypothetical protein